MSDNISIVTPKKENDYDEIPYESYPYSQTHPANLRTIGKLFGMNPPALEKATILELGCASGANLIPIAAEYPKAKCVGIDLSKVQIDTANVQVEALGLKNIEFKHMSIMDVTKDLGKFDYIIVHGILSWVPAEVQEKIFEVCKTNLTAEGIAYVSYNTLPGWNMIKSIREMMLYHASTFENSLEQVKQARSLLGFLTEATTNSESPYAKVLSQEAQLLAQQPDAYLRHDHLEENNQPFYFHEVMARAGSNELQYLGDTSIATMYLGNMPAAVASKLAEIKDIVRTEQYMDFVTNRRFRTTLLCHKNIKLNRNLNTETIRDFYVSMNIVPQTPLADMQLEDVAVNAEFSINGNKDAKISSSSPAMKAVLYTLAENAGTLLKADELVKQASAKLKKIKQADVKAEFESNAIRLVLTGNLRISSEPGRHIPQVSEKPKVADLIRFQAKSMPTLWVTNLNHDRITINIFEKYILKFLDGSHDKAAIVAKVMEAIDKGELNLQIDGKKVTDTAVIEAEISKIYDATLSRLAPNAFLVA